MDGTCMKSSQLQGNSFFYIPRYKVHMLDYCVMAWATVSLGYGVINPGTFLDSFFPSSCFIFIYSRSYCQLYMELFSHCIPLWPTGNKLLGMDCDMIIFAA